jgi:tagatose-6-phosphate ketose/aldose isomerase
MNELGKLLALTDEEKAAKGLLHTPREIHQQPATWRRSYQKFAERVWDVTGFLSRAGEQSGAGERPTVYLVGAGTSDYIGRALSALLRRQWLCEVQSVPSTDLLTTLDEFIIPGKPYLWISFSRSGDSSEGVAVIQLALERYPEVHHLIITCNGDGRMARDFGEHPNVFCLVLEDEVNDRGLAMTSSFSNMVIMGQCLAHVHSLSAYRETLEELASGAERFLGEAADMAARLAGEKFSNICFLGSGALKAVAVESALKVLELTAGGVYTWSESFLGVRHGPLSAVGEATLVVGFLSGDERRSSYELDLLREVRDKQLAGKVVAVWPDNKSRHDAFDDALSLGLRRTVEDFYRPPVDVIFGQLFGLFCSVERGLKPDTPSPKGAISRVVTQVRIH